MAEIRTYPFLRHLRADASSHVLHFRKAKLLRSGRGLSFLFRPLTDSLVEIPVEDQEFSFIYKGRTKDFQDLSAQVVVVYRVANSELLAQRIDFTIDLSTGAYLRKPLERLTNLLAQMVDRHAADLVASSNIQEMLASGTPTLRDRVEHGLRENATLKDMGLSVLSVHVTAVKPNPDLEKALEAPTRERIKQDSDEAAFQRRAMAVEKERAIQENEMQNRIELAKREEQLINQEGQNAQRKAKEDAEAAHILAESDVTRTKMEHEAEAEGIRMVEGARAEQEKARVEIYKELPSSVLMGMAAREFAGKLQTIEHLNLSPDLLSPMLANLMKAGTDRLQRES